MNQPNFGGDGYQTEQEMRRWAAAVEEKAQRYQEMQAEVARVSVTESSRDDVVRVTVDATGAVTDLVISDKHRDLAGTELSTMVLTTMRRAQSRITDHVAEVMTRTVGDDQQTVTTVVDSYRQRFPEPEPEAERPTGSVVEEMQLGDVPEDDRPPTRRSRPRPPQDDDEDWGGPPILT